MSAEIFSQTNGQRLPLRKIVLGSRGSELARTQTRMAAEALTQAWPQLEIATAIIRTSGDESGATISVANMETQAGRLRHGSGRKGIFTAELERALIEKRIDVAVHSAKDLPSEIDSAIIIAAVLPRAAVEDLLITKSPIKTLPPNPRIATGSVRRQRQIRWRRSDASIVELHGNVPTRLRKFIGADWDAIILAQAGLERLGFSRPEFEFESQNFFVEILSIERFLPAGGQGVIALQTRADDSPSREIMSAIDHLETHLCLRAEREFLRRLQGDCNTPVGVHARLENAELELRAQFFGEEIAPKMATARGKDPEKVADEAFWKIKHEHEHE